MSSLTQDIISGPGWFGERRACGALLVYTADEGDPILDALSSLTDDDQRWSCTALMNGAWLIRPESVL